MGDKNILNVLHLTPSVVGQLGTIAALAGVNVPVVQHYLGDAVAGIYLLSYLALVVWIWKLLPGKRIQKLMVVTAIVISFAVQIAALHLIAPQFDLRTDRDSALTTWLVAVGHGRYPYAEWTELNNPISVFPFMPILALPFYWLGNVGYLQIFAYLALVGLLWNTYQRAPRARVFSICVLSSAPLLFLEVTARSDLTTNMILLVSMICWLEAHQGYQWGVETYLLGGLLGCLGATRLALFPVLAVCVLYLARALPLRTAFKVGVVASVVFGILVVPFIIWDPRTFFQYAPIGVSSTKLGQSVAVQIEWSSLTVLVVLVLGLTVKRPYPLHAASALVLAIVMSATWLTFVRDLTYLQLPFIPLLFTLSRSEMQGARGLYAN